MKEKADKRPATIGEEIWSVENDSGYQVFSRSNLQRRYELKVNENISDLVFQYDIKSDPFDELTASYQIKIPIWLFCLTIFLGFVALSGVVASVSINLFAPQHYLNYGDKCDKHLNCDPNKNLICSSNSSCECSSPNLYWNSTTCIFRKTYGQTCQSNDECHKLGLHCSLNISSSCNCPKISKPQMCDCEPSQYFHPTLNRCVPRLSYGSSCLFDQQCVLEYGLKCLNGTCRCSNLEYFTGSSCEAKKSFQSACNSSVDCDESNNLTCIKGECSCSSGWFYNGASKKCDALKTINGLCDSDDHCDSSLSLKCDGTHCVCSFGFWSQWYKKCLDCDSNNWTILSNACYYFSNRSLSRIQAETECIERGGTNLCSISSEAKLDLIQTYLIEKLGSKTEQFWVGAKTTNTGQFKWSDNSTVSSDSDYWCPGQPNNNGGNRITLAEPCLAAKYTDDQFCFDDLNCLLSSKYCCEKL